MVFLRGVCGLHRAVLSGVFYCVYVRAPVYTSMCMYIPAYVCICVLPFCGKVQKLNISLKKKMCVCIYIYLLPFSFSSTGLLALLGTNVLGFFHFMKLEI